MGIEDYVLTGPKESVPPVVLDSPFSQKTEGIG
jgi:hypothetical protein